MLAKLDEWLRPCYRSVWESIYRVEAEGGRLALSECRVGLADYAGTADEKQALALYMDFLVYQLDFYFRDEPDGDGAAMLLHAFSELKKPAPAGEVSRAMQSRILLTLGSFIHARGAASIAAEQVDAWKAAVPADDMDHQAWNYISFWAFCEGRRDLLTDAYRFYLLQPVDFMVDFSRQRLKTMLALSHGRCLRSDLLRTIELLPNPLHSDWLRWFLLPVIREQGLWDAELEKALALREAALQENPQVPPSVAQPARIRGNI